MPFQLQLKATVADFIPRIRVGWHRSRFARVLHTFGSDWRRGYEIGVLLLITTWGIETGKYMYRHKRGIEIPRWADMRYFATS